MHEVLIRPMELADRSQVEPLLDEAIGRGFWDPSADLGGIVLVATARETIVGVASADVEPPEGHVRLVAVDSASRRRGIATQLVTEIVGLCEARGATVLIAYAWVHADCGVAPLTAALTNAGFVFERRIDDFYGGAVSSECPACGQSPCTCPTDLYRRESIAARGQ